ncbi:MAG: DUF3108 domain-containing protein [bacterium]
MKKQFGLFLLICIWFCAITEVRGDDSKYMMDSTGFQIRMLENDIFGTGERFVYDVDYGPITAGESGLEIMPELVTHRDAPCYEIHTWARSSPTFSVFFKVEDDIFAYMDTRGIFTWYFEKRLNEGKYHDVKIVDYDQRIGKAYMTDDGVPKDTSSIPLFVQDAISALYYFRLQPMEVGKSTYIHIHDIRKTYPLRIDVLAYETIKVPAGEFKCYKVEPVLESAGIFKQKGRIFIWFSDDQYRLPVLMKAKVLFGSIAAKLKRFTLGEPVYDF